jgi:hypothetical protein
MQEQKLAVMQPYFFPYIGYFQLIAAVDVFLLYDHVDYIKRGWINRNRFLEINRDPVYFGFEVGHVHPESLIRDVHIKFGDQERRKLLKEIYHNYRRAQFFDETYPVIDNALSGSATTISQINGYSLSVIAQHLEITTKILNGYKDAERIERELQELPEDREATNAQPDRKTQRILNICKEFQSRHYINPIGGMQIYSAEMFQKYGIRLNFVQTMPFSYTQLANQFHENLSIIDVLMNCGKEKTQLLLKKYILL